MIKKFTAISINIVSVFIILISVFVVSIGKVNAWFTAGNYKAIEITATVGNLDVNLYQYESIEDMNAEIDANNPEKGSKIITIETNEKEETNPKSYVDFSGEIKPDQPIDLMLKIKNNDLGSASMYVRFKIELFSRNPSEDVLIPIEISGVQECKADSYGFVKGDEGWWYYQYNVTDGVYNSTNNVEFGKGAEATLSTGIKIPYSSFVESNNNLKLINSDTLFIKITVNGSILKAFNV